MGTSNKIILFAFVNSYKTKQASFLLYGFFVLLLNLASLSVSFAQVTIPPSNPNETPDNTSVPNKPYGNYYGYERSAIIYTASEIGTTGTITNLGFFLNDENNAAASTPVVIYMELTTATEFAASTNYPAELAGATEVWSGNITDDMLSDNSWVTVELDTPFDYTGGASNLEILVETNGGNFGIESDIAKVFRFSETGNETRFQFWQSDGIPPGPGDPGTLSTYRPNAQLTFLTPLPVTLAYFNGIASAKGNQLNWATATETNSSHFEVERSESGLEFKAISTIKAAGTSMQLKRYAFSDKIALHAKTIYYRLKQIDSDNSFSYSKIIAIRQHEEAALLPAFPNPFQEQLTVALPAGKGNVIIELVTAAGQTVYRRTLNLNSEKGRAVLNGFSSIPPGFYLLKTDAGGLVHMQKIVKE